MENQVKYWREYYGLSQRQLAEIVGISSAEMSYIEAGKRCPDVYIALDIADALDKTVPELFGRKKRERERKKTDLAHQKK